MERRKITLRRSVEIVVFFSTSNVYYFVYRYHFWSHTPAGNLVRATKGFCYFTLMSFEKRERSKKIIVLFVCRSDFQQNYLLKCFRGFNIIKRSTLIIGRIYIIHFIFKNVYVNLDELYVFISVFQWPDHIQMKSVLGRKQSFLLFLFYFVRVFISFFILHSYAIIIRDKINGIF